MLVRKLRLERGWSQDELATMTDLSVRTIQRIERGETASLESRKALAAIFDTDPSVFAPPDETEEVTPAMSEEFVEQRHTDKQPRVTPEEARALRRVRAKRGFYMHLFWYIAVMVLLVSINLAASPGRFWAVYPMMGWGIGIAFHALSVFGTFSFLGPDWERRQVEKELGRKL